MLLGEDPIFRDGELVGRTTSGAFGYTLGRSVGIGEIHSPGRSTVTTGYIRSGSYEIEVLSERVPATPHLRPPYDPKSIRVRM
jgi:4-methylaminobutanoate oxidase (formaldehyde-forming)